MINRRSNQDSLVYKALMPLIKEAATKFYIGQRVVLSPNAGIDSNKTGTIVDSSEVVTDGRGIPTNVQGAYKPVDWKKEVAIRLDTGEIITMFKNRVLPTDS